MPIPKAWWILAIVPSFVLGVVAGWYAHRQVLLSEPIAEAQRAFEQGNFDLAIRLAQVQLRQAKGVHPEASRLVARSLASAHRWADAAKAFDGVVLKSPEDFALHATSLYQSGRTLDGFNVVTKGLQEFPKVARLMELEARMLAVQHHVSEALASSDRLVAVPGQGSGGPTDRRNDAVRGAELRASGGEHEKSA